MTKPLQSALTSIQELKDRLSGIKPPFAIRYSHSPAITPEGARLQIRSAFSELRFFCAPLNVRVPKRVKTLLKRLDAPLISSSSLHSNVSELADEYNSLRGKFQAKLDEKLNAIVRGEGP